MEHPGRASWEAMSSGKSQVPEQRDENILRKVWIQCICSTVHYGRIWGAGAVRAEHLDWKLGLIWSRAWVDHMGTRISSKGACASYGDWTGMKGVMSRSKWFSKVVFLRGWEYWGTGEEGVSVIPPAHRALKITWYNKGLGQDLGHNVQ